MCGITGFFNFDNAKELTQKSLIIIKNRGMDSCGISNLDNVNYYKDPENIKLDEIKETKSAIGHVLHSIVSITKQPLMNKKNFLVANCEIYNWKQINKKYDLTTENDAHTLFSLLENKIIENIKILDQLDGVWAFCLVVNKNVILSRDIIGEKPIWFVYNESNGSFGFSSEKKSLKKLGFENIELLSPRRVITYNIETKKLGFVDRKFITIPKSENKITFEEASKKLELLLVNSIKKRIPNKKLGLLFSGGIDSVILANILKNEGIDFTCYFAYCDGFGEPRDLEYAKKIAREMNLNLKTISIDYKTISKLLEKIIPLIESSNPIKVGVALPIYLASTKAKEDEVKVLFSGLGADEIFAGYSRFNESNNIQLDSLNLLQQIHENDIYRDDVLTMDNEIELRLPYLDMDLIKFTLGLADNYKIDVKENKNKLILREVAKNLGQPQEIFNRKKIAAQYGSNFDKGIEKLAKESKHKGKADYLTTFAKEKNMKLACLYSGGKDSNLALYIMQRQNYEISCLVSIIPANPDSYMFQQPNINFLKLQAEALDIPLVSRNTEGEKEKELKDLKIALEIAKKKYGITGVVSGALYSNYQRERIQNICNQLNLRMFSPLWHKKQDQELFELVDNKFEFVMCKIAGYGLTEKWLNKRIQEKEVKDLIRLNNKLKSGLGRGYINSKHYGFNIAGEGGEYETLVLSGPTFKKKIVIKDYSKVLKNEFTGYITIKKAELIDKETKKK